MHLYDFWPVINPESPDAAVRLAQRQEHLARYEVNVLIDNGGLTGVSVVVERNPTYRGAIAGGQ